MNELATTEEKEAKGSMYDIKMRRLTDEPWFFL